MPKQLFETHLNVVNLERAMAFYENVIGLELGIVDHDRRIAFYFIGGWNKSMLGLWEKPAAAVVAQHLAFEVEFSELESSIATLRSQGVDTLDFYLQPSEMPSVFGWMPAAGIYFRDPDGHLLEYIAPLHEPPRPEVGVVSLDGWNLSEQR